MEGLLFHLLSISQSKYPKVIPPLAFTSPRWNLEALQLSIVDMTRYVTANAIPDSQQSACHQGVTPEFSQGLNLSQVPCVHPIAQTQAQS